MVTRTTRNKADRRAHRQQWELPRLDRILVATDLSPLSRDGVQAATSLLAGNPHGEITLLHVLEEAAAFPTSDLPGAWEAGPDLSATGLANELEELRRSCQSRVSVAATRLKTGHVAETIRGVAHEDGFDLLVVTSHGRTGLARMLIGSVAEEVLHAACPVLVIKRQRNEAGEFLAEAPAFAPRRILVGYDHGSGAEVALSMARKMATLTGARLKLVQVVESPLPATVCRPGDCAGYLSLAEREALSQLAKVRASHLPEARDWEIDVRTGCPWKELSQLAGKERHDLVVIGHHETTRWGHGFMGSTAQKVIRSASCSVLVAR